MNEDDVDLVRCCLERDESAYRAFMERFQGMIFGLCYRMLSHRQDAEDVTQEVFLRIFRSLHRWDSSRPLKPWILQIAVNRCRTALSTRKRLPVPSDVAIDTLTASYTPPTSEYAEELQRALQTLREEYRSCFILFYQDELTCAEVGQVLGCPEGTVKTWLHRARRELAIQLRRRGITPEICHELR